MRYVQMTLVQDETSSSDISWDEIVSDKINLD